MYSVTNGSMKIALFHILYLSVVKETHLYFYLQVRTQISSNGLIVLFANLSNLDGFKINIFSNHRKLPSPSIDFRCIYVIYKLHWTEQCINTSIRRISVPVHKTSTLLLMTQTKTQLYKPVSVQIPSVPVALIMPFLVCLILELIGCLLLPYLKWI